MRVDVAFKLKVFQIEKVWYAQFFLVSLILVGTLAVVEVRA